LISNSVLINIKSGGSYYEEALQVRNRLRQLCRQGEDAIKKIDGVNNATVSFMTQKLTLDADDACFDEILQKVVATAKKIEPDCELHL